MNNLNNDYAIILEGVTKSYRHYQRPLDRLRETFSRATLHVERQSITDVSLRIGRGEVVGLIGRNGAGKSTLLKMIAGRLEPTSGSVLVNGSVSAILELGTGFHPDLSGRENVRVGGLCLGLTRAQIEREMENIIAFSELEDVIDMPFRTFSTGMQARLTFATAVTVDPDILIIDEALSVGDNKFQLKSFDRIRRFKDDGRTILLVTHSMSSVTSFCDRAILLEKGKVLADGDPNWVTSVYHHLQFGELDLSSLTPPSPRDAGERPERPATGHESDPTAEVAARARHSNLVEADGLDNGSRAVHIVEPDVEPSLAIPSSSIIRHAMAIPRMRDSIETYEAGVKKGYRYGDRQATIEGVSIVDETGAIVRQLLPSRKYAIVMDCVSHIDSPQLYCGILIRDLRGDTLLGVDSVTSRPQGSELLQNIRAGEVRRIAMMITNWLASGDYVVTAAVTTQAGRQSDMWFDAFEFTVVETPQLHAASRVNLLPSFFIESLHDATCGAAE